MKVFEDRVSGYGNVSAAAYDYKVKALLIATVQGITNVILFITFTCMFGVFGVSGHA